MGTFLANSVQLAEIEPSGETKADREAIQVFSDRIMAKEGTIRHLKPPPGGQADLRPLDSVGIYFSNGHLSDEYQRVAEAERPGQRRLSGSVYKGGGGAGAGPTGMPNATGVVFAAESQKS